MILNLVLNNNNVVSGSNNTRYKYKFNAPLEIMDEAEMTIANVTMPYSWFNITKANSNNQFTMSYPIAGTGTYTFTQTIPDCYFSVVDLNAYIQSLFIAQGFYLINGEGNYVYYFQLLYNPTYYAVQIVSTSVPLSLPSGWTQPSTWTGYPTSGTLSVSFTPNAGLAKILGFSAGLVSPNTTSYSVLSTLVPQGSVVNSLVIRSNIIDNDSGFPTDVLDTMPITSSFGTNINYSPPTLKWIKCTAGTFQSFEVFFCDQNLNSMYILDNNVCISILLKNKGKIISTNINEQEGRSQKLVQRLALELEE